MTLPDLLRAYVAFVSALQTYRAEHPGREIPVFMQYTLHYYEEQVMARGLTPLVAC